MSIQKAYSLELKKEVSAFQANALALKNKISDPHAFRCVGSNDCNIPLQCINFDKAYDQRKVAPYFKIPKGTTIMNHSKNCIYHKKVIRNNEIQKVLNGYNLKDTRELNLVLSTSGFMEPKASHNYITDNNTAHDSNSSFIRKQPMKKHMEKEKNTNVKSLKAIIDIYNNSDVYDKETIVNLPNNKISLDQLFINLDIEKTIPSHNFERIYFGDAKIEERKSTDAYYIIKFTTQHRIIFEGNSRLTNPSILVFKDQIQSHKHLKALASIVNTNKIFKCYFFGVPIIENFFNFKVNKNYHNLYVII